MTLEEIFKTNPELLNAPEVQMLVAHVQEQQNNNHTVNQNHMQFRAKISDLIFASDHFIINGISADTTIERIIKIL